MGKFRKKPVTIEAWLISDLIKAAKTKWSDLPSAVAGAYERGEILFLDGRIEVKTLEGWMDGPGTSMLILGVKNELYSCRWDIFLQTYEPTADPDSMSAFSRMGGNETQD